MTSPESIIPLYHIQGLRHRFSTSCLRRTLDYIGMEAIQASPGLEQSGKKLSFDGLAFELRAMIFQHLDLPWLHPGTKSFPSYFSMPSIIVALRPQPLPYQQILALFYSQNTFVLHEGNGYSFRWMAAPVIQSIQELTIRVAINDTRVPFTPDTLCHMNNSITKLNLSLDFSPRVTDSTVYNFLDVFPKWVQHFTELKNLEVQIAVMKPEPWATGYHVHIGKPFAETQARICRFDELVDGKSQFVSRMGRSLRTSEMWRQDGIVVVENWKWTPLEEGGVMNWSKVTAEAMEIQDTKQEEL